PIFQRKTVEVAVHELKINDSGSQDSNRSLSLAKNHQGDFTETKPPRRPSMRKTLIIVAASSCVILALIGPLRKAWQGQTVVSGRQRDPKDKPAPITVAPATSEVIPITVRTIGNVMPYSVVNVVPQVGGQLLRVTFTQGDFVKKGDLLF